MPTFKVTLMVHDGLSLGSILMTKNVELINISEVNEANKTVHKKIHSTNVKREYKRPFKHPSGKRLIDFVLEKLQETSPESIKWKELHDMSMKLGYSKSSINNAIRRLVEKDAIEVPEHGYYRLIRPNN
jgi:DNA replicative helicase MCM subunit Mcm2 (Cdc46/Mcm family)